MIRGVLSKPSFRGLHGFRASLTDFSSRPWRNLPPTWVIHMATRRPAHNTPIHMDILYGFRPKGSKSMWIGVLWAGLRVAMWITHVGSKFRHGLLDSAPRKVTGSRGFLEILEFVAVYCFERGSVFEISSPMISWFHGSRGFQFERRTTTFLNNPLPALRKCDSDPYSNRARRTPREACCETKARQHFEN